MKTFSYTARNAAGKVIEGTVKTANFQHATESIRAQGLELISLEEMQQQVEVLRSSVYEALDDQSDQEAENSSETDNQQGQDNSVVFRGLHQEQVDAAQAEASHQQPAAVQAVVSESIIFSPAQKKPLWSRSFPHEKLEKAKSELDELLTRSHLSQELKQDLDKLLQKLILVKEHQNKKYWKDLRKEIKAKVKQVKRFLDDRHDQSWQQLQQSSDKVESYSEFSEQVQEERRGEQQKVQKVKHSSSFMKLLQTLSDPNPHEETEVLLKQRYESVWIEVDRFMGALMVFYLCFFFLGYYLKRSGIEDSLLIDIYSATLFKQITLGLFLFSAAIGVRNQFLPKKVAVDGVVLAVWLLSTWWLIL